MNEIGNLFEPSQSDARLLATRNPLFRAAIDIGLGALLGAGLASHIFALAWAPVPERLADRTFNMLVLGASVLGVIAYFIALPRFWRQARRRITPWIAIGVSLWVTANWSVQLMPSAASEHLADPRANLAVYAILTELALFVVAALAFIDWRINRDEQLELEKRNG